MAVYLNTNKNLENYKELYNEEYFVDKSKIISLINKTYELSLQLTPIPSTRTKLFNST